MKKLIAILTVIVVTFSLTSCGGPSPTDVTKTFFDGIKDLNFETMASVYKDGNTQNSHGNEALDKFGDFDQQDKQILSRFKKEPFNKLLSFDYQLSNEKIDGDKATVDVTITTYDMAKPYENFMKKFMILALGMEENVSDKVMTDKMLSLAEGELAKLKEKTYKKTVTIDLLKVDNQWKIDNISKNVDLINALTGGLLDLLNKTDNLLS